MEYEIVETSIGSQILKRTNLDGSVTWIPIDEANSDYQAYLATLASESPAAPTA